MFCYFSLNLHASSQSPATLRHKLYVFLQCSATFQLELQFVKLPGVARLVHRETILLCFRCSSAQCRLHFIFSRWIAFCSRPETYLGSLVVSLELRTSDFTTALPGTRLLTGAQAVRPRSLHRDAPAATRSLPSEALSYSYNPSGSASGVAHIGFGESPD